jgi:hypothetical protein
MAEKKAAQGKVRILHDRVGDFERGRVVPLSDMGDGVDHESLVNQGAIEYVDDDAMDDQQAWSLYRVNRSESPPTLPNAPFVTESQHEVHIAAGMVPPDSGTVHPGGASYVGPDELRANPEGKRR